MPRFEQQYEEWLVSNLKNESNHRRKELLGKGLGHGTVEFLRKVWFPAIGNFDHLFPEWEVRDFNNGYRYLDLAYMPGGAKGGIEIQGFDYRRTQAMSTVGVVFYRQIHCDGCCFHLNLARSGDPSLRKTSAQGIHTFGAC